MEENNSQNKLGWQGIFVIILLGFIALIWILSSGNNVPSTTQNKIDLAKLESQCFQDGNNYIKENYKFIPRTQPSFNKTRIHFNTNDYKCYIYVSYDAPFLNDNLITQERIWDLEGNSYINCAYDPSKPKDEIYTCYQGTIKTNNSESLDNAYMKYFQTTCGIYKNPC